MKFSKYAAGPVEFGSIRAIYCRLQSEGYCIGEGTLRAWVKAGIIPAIYNGRSAKILYSDVLAYITRTSDPKPAA